MFQSYRELFRAPGVHGWMWAGGLARLALPMTGIGMITMLAQHGAGYGMAGAVAATFVATYALLSPQISRLADRYGQARVLPVAAAASVLGLVLLALAVWQGAAPETWFVAAMLAGLMPSISAMMRARWVTLPQGRQHLHTAYAWETVLDEMSFIVGPPLSVGLAVACAPAAGVLAAALLLAVGVLLLRGQRRSEPPVHVGAARAGASRTVIVQADVWRLTLFMVALGVIVGVVDILSVALAQQAGKPLLASLVLSAYAFGACVAGLWFGARQSVAGRLPRLLRWGGLATAATVLPFWWVGQPEALAAAVLLAGLCFAPTMIVAMGLLERLAPAHQLTEAMTWLLAGLNVGVALGAALAGQQVEAGGIAAGVAVAQAAGVAAAGVACWLSWSLRARGLPTVARA